MVEDDGAEVTAVVVGNEVFSGVGALQTACSHALVLQQSLVQCKKHLQRERQMFLLPFYLKHTSLLHFLRSAMLRLSKKWVPFQNKCNVTLIYNGVLIARCNWNLSVWWLHFCLNIFIFPLVPLDNVKWWEILLTGGQNGRKKTYITFPLLLNRARAL